MTAGIVPNDATRQRALELATAIGNLKIANKNVDDAKAAFDGAKVAQAKALDAETAAYAEFQAEQERQQNPGWSQTKPTARPTDPDSPVK